MTQSELSSEIKKGAIGRYFLFGREEYMKKFYLGRLRESVLGDDETLSDFNYYKLKWGEDSLEAIENATAALPVMAEKTFVEIHCDFSKMKDHAMLSDILVSSDEEGTVLVLVSDGDGFEYGNLSKNRPSEAYKIYSQHFKCVPFETATPSEIKKWIARRLSRDDLRITTDATELMLERCQKDMQRLSGEIDKLAAAALARGCDAVTSELVAEITCKEDSDDAFALANAILNGDRAKALHELSLCKRRQDKAPMVLGSVARAICDMTSVSLLLRGGYEKAEIARKMKMHEYRAGLYINAVSGTDPRRLIAASRRLREADILMKTSRLDYIALERFICTIPRRK